MLLPSPRQWRKQQDFFFGVVKDRPATPCLCVADFSDDPPAADPVAQAAPQPPRSPVFSPAMGLTSGMPPLFSPLRGTTWAEEFDSPFAPSPPMTKPWDCPDSPCSDTCSEASAPVSEASPVAVRTAKDHAHPRHAAEDRVRVRYSVQHLMALMEVPLVAETIQMPDGLEWLDKRVDLGLCEFRKCVASCGMNRGG